jgi:prepilin-type N-terminal cleavage/methylation domain-containing protein
MAPRAHGPRSARARRAPRGRGGFTLAEVAVTIVIVGIALTMIAQGLHKSKFEAAHTRNLKVARELALTTLGEIAGGVYAEDLEGDDRLDGTYADYGYEKFTYEVLIGEDQKFPDVDDDRRSALPNDTVLARREREEEERRDSDEDEEDDVEQPYEVVKIRVIFPTFKEYKNDLVLEQWMEWRLIHGEPENAGAAQAVAGAAGGNTGAGASAGAAGGGMPR